MNIAMAKEYLMANKESTDLGGGIFAAIMDLTTILLLKLTEVLTWGIEYLLKRYVLKFRGEKLKKIERKDLQCRKTTAKLTAFGYSVSQKRTLFTNELDRRKHTLVCGASGFGKTVLIDTLMYDDMIRNKPVIFIDPKGDNRSLNQFINLCRIARREFWVFSEYYNSAQAIALNPAKEGSFTHIADRIHYSFNWSEEHYETLCYRALKTACRKILTAQKAVSYQAILDTLLEVSHPQKKTREFERKNIEGIIARLENVVQSDFGPKLAENGLSIKEVWQAKKCIYIGMPVLGYPKIARGLGKLILGDLAYAVYDAYRNASLGDEKNWPVGVYIDELSAVITDEFIELLNKCRGVGMEVNFAFQSPSDINKVCPSLCEQILENSSNWFIFKQRMESGANTFAEAIGTAESTKQTMRVVDGQEQAQGSQRKVEELIAHHNIIKSLNPGQAVLLRHAPMQVDLVNIKYIDPAQAQGHVNILQKRKWIKELKTETAIDEEDTGKRIAG